MSIVSLSTPEGWEAKISRMGSRVRVELFRPDNPSTTPLITVEEYPEYLQGEVDGAIDDWGNAQ